MTTVSFQTLSDPKSLRTRETHLYEVVLEHVFRRAFRDLMVEAKATTGGTERDLLQMGKRIYMDIARVARGELSSIHIPNRMPYPNEYV